MDIQRLRNLTTGVLHTEMSHIYKDLEYISGNKGIMTHMIPRVLRAVEPWLREKVQDERFWDGKWDTSHTGEFHLDPMTNEEQEKMFNRFAALTEKHGMFGEVSKP
jgi:hypothetical protein